MKNEEQLICEIEALLRNDEICYVHVVSKEIISIPIYFLNESNYEYQYDFEPEDDFIAIDWKRIQKNRECYIEIYPPENLSIDWKEYIRLNFKR